MPCYKNALEFEQLPQIIVPRIQVQVLSDDACTVYILYNSRTAEAKNVWEQWNP